MTSSKPKILFFVPLPPPVHGAALRNKSLLESKLLNELFNIHCIPFNFAEETDDIGKFSFTKIFKSFVRLFQLAGKIISFRPDLVYFNPSLYGFAFYRDFFYILIFKLSGQRLLYHLRTQGVKTQVENSFIKREMFKCIFRNSKVICLSDFLTSDIKAVYEDKPFVVNNGIEDVPEIYRLKQRITNRVPVILFFANLAIAKGLIDFINALQSLKLRGFEFSAVVAGDPANLSIRALEQKVRELGLESRITILGPRFGEEKFKIFNSADIYVLPTYFEAFPGTVLEAMQFSLPVISTFEGAIPEIVDNGVTGLLVKKNDVNDLAEKLQILISNPTLRQEMGRNGREKFIKRFTMETFETNIAAVFTKVINR